MNAQYIRIPKFKKGDIVYYVGDSPRSYDKNRPYVVVDCKSKAEALYGLGITKGNATIYVDPDDFISEEEFKKRKLNDNLQKQQPSFDPKVGDIVYYVGNGNIIDPNNRLKKDVPYRLFRHPKYIIGKEFFEIGVIEPTDISYLTIEKEDIKSNFISEEEYKRKNKDILKNKEKFKDGQIVYYVGPQNKDYEYDTPYRINFNKKFTDRCDIYVRKQKEKFGTWHSPNKKWVDENFATEEEYFIKKKSGGGGFADFVSSGEKSGYRVFPDVVHNNERRIKYNDTVYYIGKGTSAKFPDTLGGLKSLSLLKTDTPYKVDFVNIEAGMIRIKETGYSYPEKDFVTEEEYEKLKMANDENLESTSEVGKNKTDVELRMQIFKDTTLGKITWTRPYATHDEWFRTYIYLKDPPNSHLRIDVKRLYESDKWEIVIYYHRNRNPLSGVGGENPIVVKRMTHTNTMEKIARKIEMQIEENEKKMDEEEEEEEEPRITWD